MEQFFPIGIQRNNEIDVARGLFPMKSSDQAKFADKILRGEISAVEAYDQVIEKFITDPEAPISLLAQIRSEHQRSCESLRLLVSKKGEDPSEDSGAWGKVVSGLLNVRSLLGQDQVLRTLRTGEDHGLRLYQDALDLGLTERERATIRDILIPRQVRHIAQLDSLIDSETKYS